MATLKDFRDERLRKLEELKKLGVNPYPANTERTHKLAQIIEQFDQLQGQEVSVVGRIVNIRKFGKIAFVVIRDASGTLQLFLREGVVETLKAEDSQLGIEQLPLLDSGDFVEAHGPVIKTQTGETSIEVRRLRLLTKALRPLPSAQEGFTNKEERLRRRYVDTNVNQDVYGRFLRRSMFWQSTREFLMSEGFVEINIPVLELTTGGADANPFVTHMDALGQDFYLRISHELPLKRLLVGGYEKVFDIGPRFRNENYSDEHLPEHVAMEWYWAYADWQQGMKLTERLVRQVADRTWGTRQFKLATGMEVDLGPDNQEWPRISFVDVIRDNYGLDVFTSSLDEVKEQLRAHNIEVEQTENRSRGIDKLWKKVRTTLAGPAFLVDIPTFLQPLAKTQVNNPELTEQFNLLLGGTELCKAYSELNDPIDQLNRFKEQQAMRDAGDDEAMMLDIDYVEALEYAMPPACGFGFSERVFWYLEGVTAREGVIFPQLRREVDEVTKGLYPELQLSTAGRATRRNLSAPSVDLPAEGEYRLAVILNKNVEDGRLLNAASHAVSGLIGTLPDPQALHYLEYRDKTGEFDAVISHHPTIVLRAADSKELQKAYRKAQQAHLSANVFIETMTLGPSLEEIAIVKDKTIDELDFWGVVIFGKTEDVQRVTKDFQLF
ncbi:MAG TPA: lysine--tRNA ligase [Bacillota bacterium]|nr:lysine--tRNA ligase [Bacillota bacterium]